MKFDVVIGNPPYQHPSSPGVKLWTKFYKKSIDICKNNGYISLLTPSSFIKRDGKSFDHLRNKINQNTIIEINTYINQYFNVGEDIILTFIKKSKPNSKNYNINIVFNDGGNIVSEYQKHNSGLNFTFGQHDKFIKNIFNKLVSKSPKIKLNEDVHDNQKRRVLSGEFSNKKTEVYKYPVIYTPNTTHYAKELFGSKDSLKLMLTLAGTYYNPDKPNRNIFVSTEMSGQGMLHLDIKSEKEGKNIKSFLISKLYRFYINSEKTSGYNTGLKNLPMLDSSRKWTDHEIYEYFNLTQEEIDYIENAV